MGWQIRFESQAKKEFSALGNYRIISRAYDNEVAILLLAIRKRDVVYKIKL
jgi:mRNA-degrading endonuclease RelE of RelBE toxin-antitoxin system